MKREVRSEGRLRAEKSTKKLGKDGLRSRELLIFSVAQAVSNDSTYFELAIGLMFESMNNPIHAIIQPIAHQRLNALSPMQS
jgi:hypothetical protein